MSDNTFLVVIDPAQQSQPALERAIQSCQLTGGKIHLFECVNESYNGHLSGSPDQRKQAIMSEFQHQLDPLIDRVRLLDIEVSHELVWGEDWSKAIVEAASRTNCYMVFKSSYIHSRAERIQKTADWSILRDSPCPVLLMHHNSNWENRRVLAAINMAATDEQHIALNKKVIHVAASFAQTYDAAVHFVNSYMPEVIKSTAAAASDDIFYDEGEDIPNAEPIEMTEATLAKYCNTDTDHAHLVSGPRDDAILTTAKKLGVDLIIVGSVKRKGIKGRVIGNTSEKLLDRTSADILTIL